LRELRAIADSQALAFRSMEQLRVIEEQLLQAKAQVADLQAEIRIKDAALDAKDAVLQSKDSVIDAKDALISCLREDLQLRSDGPAVAKLLSAVASGSPAPAADAACQPPPPPPLAPPPSHVPPSAPRPSPSSSHVIVIDDDGEDKALKAAVAAIILENKRRRPCSRHASQRELSHTRSVAWAPCRRKLFAGLSNGSCSFTSALSTTGRRKSIPTSNSL
jgi:hypothetical protein